MGESIAETLSALVAGQEALLKRINELESRSKPGRSRGKGETLGSYLHKESGGKIRRSTRARPSSSRRVDYSEDESSDASSSSASEEETRARRSFLSKTKGGDKKFWRDFMKVPFPVQTLRYDSSEGGSMLRRALTNYPTVSAYVESKVLKQLRNQREAQVLGRSVDCLIDEFGIMKAKDSKAVEVLMRRLAAILMAERTGSWEAAEELVREDNDLLDERTMKRIRKSAKLQKELAKRKPPVQGEGQ